MRKAAVALALGIAIGWLAVPAAAAAQEEPPAKEVQR
jgi:hypothetical protein